MEKGLKTSELFDLTRSLAGDYLGKFTFPWEALAGLKDFIISLGEGLKGYAQRAPSVWVHKSAKISPSAYIGAPCIICENAEVRHCAFIRGSAIVGRDCVVGNSCELKNAVLFDGVQVPHYNYVGDSILGYRAHMGAGSVTSNVKSDRTSVTVKCGGREIRTGLKKLGAMLGDGAEIGCNSVLNPGTVIGKNTTVYPLSNVRGVVPADSIFKGGGIITEKR